MTNATTSRFPELGFYALPGHTSTPADMFGELRDAEALGVGSAWISERFDVKEAASLCGAAGAVTEHMYVGTSATNVNSRHPLVTASMATTLHRLTSGRFALGIGRGVGLRFDMMGLPHVSNPHLRDFVDLMKKLWRGERVSYEGPLGTIPYMHLGDWVNDDIPLLFIGFGPRSLSFAGSLFNGVMLHTFISDDGLARAVRLIREGAERAGRDPDAVKIWSVVAMACDASEETYLRYIVARMGTYLQAPGYGELLVALNDWDVSVLERFRSDDVVGSMRGGIDSVATPDQLRHIRGLIPEEWLPAAVGNATQCAARLNEQFRAGADGVVIHASKPHEFAPVLEAYRGLRDHARFAGRSNRPC